MRPFQTDWMPRLDGSRWHLWRPETWTVDLDEIARGLANTCRFSGLMERYYSVAQHSWTVARLVRPELRPLAMIHDAGELYSGGDIPRPLKRSPMCSGLTCMEYDVLEWLPPSWGLLPWPMLEELQAADDAVLLAESEQLLGRSDLLAEGEPADVRIRPVGPSCAYHTWLGYWQEYLGYWQEYTEAVP